MTSYIVTFDLNAQGQNYKALNDAIQSFGSWAKVATTTYVIKTSHTAKELRDMLQSKIDSNDELLVAKLSGEAAWRGLSDKISAWLKNNL